MKNNKSNKWMKPRHKLVRNILYAVLKPYSKIKYGITAEPFKEQNGRQYLILINHQTAFDQFFVGMAFKGSVYYVASEDLFSKGWVSSLIRYLVAPIPIKKQTTDVRAVLNCMKVAKEGGTIAIAPEGNRTYSGKTEYMSPSIVPLARKLELPIALFRIEGGYGVHPRWSDVVRKGKMRGYVSEVIEPEEYEQLSNDELFERIKEGLYVDEAVNDYKFYHKKSAEYLERVLYVCPYCSLSRFESKNDIIRCTKCDRQIRYLPTKELQGIGFDLPFRFVADWYKYQCDFINELNLAPYINTPMYEDTVNLFEVIPYKNKKLLQKDVALSLYGDKLVIGEQGLQFDEILAISVLGRNKLNIYHNDKIYQIKGDKRFNALKHVNIYFHHKNVKGGNSNDKFLGL